MANKWSLSSKLVGWGVFALALVGAAIAWFALDPGFRAGRETPRVRADMPKDEFERRVRGYLLDNPEVIAEAIRRLESRQSTTELGETRAVLNARADEVFRDPNSPVGGNPEGDVTLVEFFDYNCPYCRRVAPILNEIERTDPDLRLVYKEWPILGPNSEFAARAALGARRQGKYVEFHKAMMLGGGILDESKVIEVAKNVGLDLDRLKSDMEDPTNADIIKRNDDLARTLRITGTPGFVIGDEILRGAADIEVIRGLILQARKKELK